VDGRIVGQAGGRSVIREDVQEVGQNSDERAVVLACAFMQSIWRSFKKSFGRLGSPLGRHARVKAVSRLVVQAVRRSFKQFGDRSSSSAVVQAVRRSFKQFGGGSGSYAVVQAVRRSFRQFGGGSGSSAAGGRVLRQSVGRWFRQSSWRIVRRVSRVQADSRAVSQACDLIGGLTNRQYERRD